MGKSVRRGFHLKKVQVCGGFLQLNLYVIFFLSRIPLELSHREEYKHAKNLFGAKKLLCVR